MRIPLRLALSFLPLAGWLQAQVPPSSPALPSPASGDATLAELLRETLTRNPEAARALALRKAERERVPQARALPDPTLALGVQNDGFKKLQVGQMETSFYQVMVTQALPWPGKRALREEIARLGAEGVDVASQRVLLGLEAEVRRAYAGLLLARGQQTLLEEQGIFLRQAEAIARARYGVGQGSQADCFRAQLELTRLQQTRLNLAAQVRSLQGALNRLRARPLETPLTPGGTLEALPELPVPSWEEAQVQSPELQAARLGIRQAQRGLDLARLETRPDFSVTAGLMPRGSLDPMWTASVGVSVPLWRGQKQHRAVAEQEQRRQAQGSEAQNVENILAERMQERANQLEASTGALRLYREGLLVQSEGSFRATLAQYEAGLAPFLSVLEALNGWVADRSGYLQTLAQAQAIRIAFTELNLGPTPSISDLRLGSTAMGGGGATASAAPGGARPGGPNPADENASSSMKSM